MMKLTYAHTDIPLAAPSKAWVYGRSLAGIAGSNPAGGVEVCLCDLCAVQVETSATSRSFAQGSPTGCVCVSH
jgi:hypothetical protein